MTQGPASSLASHLINQIRSNLSLLEQLSVIQPQDADQIRTKLPPPGGPFPSLDVGGSGNMGMSSTVSLLPYHIANLASWCYPSWTER